MLGGKPDVCHWDAINVPEESQQPAQLDGVGVGAGVGAGLGVGVGVGVVGHTLSMLSTQKLEDAELLNTVDAFTIRSTTPSTTFKSKVAIMISVSVNVPLSKSIVSPTG